MTTPYTPASELQSSTQRRLETTEARPHTRYTIGNPIITCQVQKEQDKNFPGQPGHPNWVYIFSPYTDVKIRLYTRDEAQAALLEQLAQVLAVYAEATGNTIRLDQLATKEWPYLPLSVSWKTDSNGKRIVTGFSVIDLKPDLPLWGQAGPWYANFIRAIQIGEAVIDEKLGLPRLRWPSYMECRDICNTVPMKPHKDVPDAKDNPDWSIALGGTQPVSDQTAEPTAREAIRGNEQPVEDKPVHWIDDTKACKTFWATVMPWIKWSGHKGEAQDFVHTEIGKIHDWTDGYDPLVERITKTAIVRKMEAVLGRELVAEDFLKATGFKSLRSAVEVGQSADQIRGLIDEYLASAKSEPQNGQNPVASSTTPETPAKPVAAKSDGKKDASVNDTPTDKKDEIRAKYNKPQRGNDYLMVQGRVLLFRLEHPDWTIETDLIGMTDDAAVFKATIRNAEGRIVATGHGRASEAGTRNLGGRYIEKAETAAIGRALALAGFGTDSSLDDADYLADSPVAKAA